MMPNREKIEIAALYGETEDEIQVAQCGDQVRMRLRGIEEDDISPYVFYSQRAFRASLVPPWLFLPMITYILSQPFTCCLHGTC